jgi:hypothetical protein
VAVFSVTASAAFPITSSTKSGWDSIGTWLLSVSKVFAPMRFATKRSKMGWMVRSLLSSVERMAIRAHFDADFRQCRPRFEGVTARARNRAAATRRMDISFHFTCCRSIWFKTKNNTT